MEFFPADVKSTSFLGSLSILRQGQRFLVPVLALLASLVVLPTLCLARPLVVGTIDQSPSKILPAYAPLADYLARRLVGHGIVGGEVLVVKDIEAMTSLMKQGKVDVLIEGSLASLVVNDRCGGKMILRCWPKGMTEVHAVIFVREDSPVQRLDQLSGMTLAFKNQGSCPGYLLPGLALRNAGFSILENPAAEGKTQPGQIRVLFSGQDENTLLWVLRGKAAAGGLAWDHLLELAGGHLKDLRVVARTPSVPRLVVSTAPGIGEGLREDIRSILLEMEKTEPGRAVLSTFYNSTRFDALPEQAQMILESLLPELRQLLEAP